MSPTHSCFSPDGPLSFDFFSQIPGEKYQRNNVRRFQLFKSFTGWSTSVSSDRNLSRSQPFRGVVDLHFAESVNESVVDSFVDAVGRDLYCRQRSNTQIREDSFHDAQIQKHIQRRFGSP